jgi:hypothetical protein
VRHQLIHQLKLFDNIINQLPTNHRRKMSTIQFEISIDDLLETSGVEGLNRFLDERLRECMALDPEFDGVLPTDVIYTPLSVTPGDDGLIVVVADFTSELI